MVLEMIEITEECLYSNHCPNKKTLKSIKNIEKGKNLTEIKNIKDLKKKFGL